MKKAGLMAASLGTAALLAVGAGSVVALLADPSHGVEEANASEVKAWTPPRTNGARELAHAESARVSDAQQLETAAQRSGSATGLPTNEATRAPHKAIKDQAPRRSRVVHGDDDDDDDWGDD